MKDALKLSLLHRLYRVPAAFFRARRRAWLRRELPQIATGTVLDVGGYPWCWPEAGASARVTLFNLQFSPEHRAEYPQFTFVEGDGCRMPFADRSFDLVHSNSVIEHVGTWERQQAFAAEARRVGRALWVQTPAREFFVEPHLLAPFVHWLPRRWQRRLIRHGTVWGWMTRPSAAQVEGFLDEVRLLSRGEMTALFPDCTILTERFLGLPKSYIALRRG